jgi:tetratricopeptide (TPR) repeat protein
LYARHLEGHAAELAEHFSHSTDPADLAKAVSYGEIAARRATDVYAYGEAVRLLEQALKVQEVLDPQDKARRCDLLLALGDALVLAGEHRRVVSTEASQAFTLAEAIGDNKRASRASVLAMRGLFVHGTIGASSSEAAEWAARTDRYAEPETVERAWADCMLGVVKVLVERRLSEGVALISRSLALASRLGDRDKYWWAAGLWLWFAGAPEHDEKRLRLAEELAGQSRQGVNLHTCTFALLVIVQTFLEFGQRRRAEEIMAEMKMLAERTGQPNLLIYSMVADAVMAIWDGHLEEAVAMRRHILARAEQLGIPEFASVWASWVLPARVYLGDAGRALESNLQGSRNQPRNAASDMMILFCLAHLGRCAEVAEMLKQDVLAHPGTDSAEDQLNMFPYTTLLESAVLTEHRETADLLLHRQTSSSRRTSGLWLTTCTGRHMGAAAALLGRPGEARKYYQEAMKACTEIRFRPEVALSRLQLAELLLEHYPDEKKEALEHLDFAIKEFRDMKMQPSLERALRHKDILKA